MAFYEGSFYIIVFAICFYIEGSACYLRIQLIIYINKKKVLPYWHLLQNRPHHSWQPIVHYLKKLQENTVQLKH